MSSYNHVTLMGNLTRDPDFKTLDLGSSVANFGMAMNKVYQDKNGEKQESVVFVDIEVWNRQAEIANEYLFKGKRVLIDGELKFDQWEDESGKRQKLSVRAHRIVFADSKREEDGEGEAQPATSAASTGSQTSTPGSSPPSSTSEDDIPF